MIHGEVNHVCHKIADGSRSRPGGIWSFVRIESHWPSLPRTVVGWIALVAAVSGEMSFMDPLEELRRRIL